MCVWAGELETICVCVCVCVFVWECISVHHPSQFPSMAPRAFCIKRIKEVSFGGREVGFTERQLAASLNVSCGLKPGWHVVWCLEERGGKRETERGGEREGERWWLAARCLGWRQNSSLINVMRRVGPAVLSRALNAGLPSTSSLPASVGVTHVMFSVYEPLLRITFPPMLPHQNTAATRQHGAN